MTRQFDGTTMGTLLTKWNTMDQLHSDIGTYAHKIQHLLQLTYLAYLQLFKSFLEHHIELKQEDWALISRSVHEESCEKSQLLTCYNEVENNLYFLKEGIARLCHETEDKDTTINIGFPGDFISSYSSFLTRNPSEFNLQTLTGCKYLVIEYDVLNSLYEKTSCGQQLGRVLTERLFLYSRSVKMIFY